LRNLVFSSGLFSSAAGLIIIIIIIIIWPYIVTLPLKVVFDAFEYKLPVTRGRTTSVVNCRENQRFVSTINKDVQYPGVPPRPSGRRSIIAGC